MRMKEIEELKHLVKVKWNSEVSSLALKIMKERKAVKPNSIPLSSDIALLQKHLDSEAAEAYRNLENHVNVRFNYIKFVKAVYAMTTIFNRKRVRDVMYLTIST